MIDTFRHSRKTVARGKRIKPGITDEVPLLDWTDPKDQGEKSEARLRFERFDAANPMVWELFVKFSRTALRAGRKALSSKLIVERIRWEVYVTTKSEDEFKINNNWTAFYARKFMARYPEYKGFFRTRSSGADK